MIQKSVKDYYAILGVLSTASLEEIRLAYRRQARAYHPDLSTDPDAEERFKEINEAYDILANSEKRQA
jgi:curved DNA-binding protein CbpA